MKKSTIVATFTSDIKKVWNMVTDNFNCVWRSDLSQITVFGKTELEWEKYYD